MTTGSQRPEGILAEVLDHSAAATRQAYPDRACTGDAALRREVESLVAAHQQADERKPDDVRL